MPYQMSLPYLKNNYVYLSFLLAYIAINLGLFISRGVEYYNQDSNGLTIAARACGECSCVWGERGEKRVNLPSDMF